MCREGKGWRKWRREDLKDRDYSMRIDAKKGSVLIIGVGWSTAVWKKI
jgi:hypothetical protein